MEYDFPGNVRELENIIERGVALENSNIILPESLTLSLHQKRRPDKQLNPLFQAVADEDELFELGLDAIVGRLEKSLIEYCLNKADHSKMRAAELLKVSFRSLRYKIQKYGIS